MGAQRATYIYRWAGTSLASDVELPSLGLEAPDAGSLPIRLVHGAGARPADVTTWPIKHRAQAEPEDFLFIRREADAYRAWHTDGVAITSSITHGEDGIAVSARVTVDYVEPSLGSAQLEHVLLDQLLPLVMAQLGRLSFHGSAVELDGRAVCFLAESKTGKSTLAAALARHAGARFLADDQVVLEDAPDGLRAHPSYASVRLWSASAETLFSADARIEKRRYHLAPATGPARLAAMVLLVHGLEAQVEPAIVEPLSLRDGLTGIATHLDRLDPTDRAALRRELEQLGRLAERVPIVRLRVARRLERLEEVARAVASWARSLDGDVSSAPEERRGEPRDERGASREAPAARGSARGRAI